MKVKFTVLGEPQGKGRPKFARFGKYTRTYTPAQTVLYENLIRTEYRAQCGNVYFEKEVMLDLRILAYYSIPKSASKKKQEQMRKGIIRPQKKPDMDNVIKVVADSLNKIAYYDDAQIVDAMIRKFYADKPKVVIILQDIGGNEE